MKTAWKVHAVSALLIGASLLAWYATGTEGFTRWPNERLARSDAPAAAGESDLLADIGFTDSTSAVQAPNIESRFAFGLVPGGPDPRHLPSVATLSAIAILMSIITIAMTRRRGPNGSIASPANR